MFPIMPAAAAGCLKQAAHTSKLFFLFCYCCCFFYVVFPFSKLLFVDTWFEYYSFFQRFYLATNCGVAHPSCAAPILRGVIVVQKWKKITKTAGWKCRKFASHFDTLSSSFLLPTCLLYTATSVIYPQKYAASIYLVKENHGFK